MNEVTRILHSIEADPQAADDLLPLVYDELRRLAKVRLMHERVGQTLDATALVHEAYLRLVGSEEAIEWNGRRHFFAAAAEAMRRILIDRARARHTQKRGGDRQRVNLNSVDPPILEQPAKLLALNDALARLEALDRTKAELVKLRFFTGLTNRQAAAVLDISESTADRYWAFARAW